METCADCEREIDEAKGVVRYTPPRRDIDGDVLFRGAWYTPLLRAWPAAGAYCPRCWVRTAKGLRVAYRHAHAEARDRAKAEARAARVKAREQRAAEREADRRAREDRKAARVAAGLRRAQAREERAAQVAARKARKEATP